MKIGERIEKLLSEKGITQRDLAKRIGIDETTISRIITGERKPRSEVIANIATALHTTSDYLLGIEETQNEEFNINKITRLIARNSSKLSDKDRKELINALFKEE